jgi:tripartite-type tricarboxylate transporter receptor subunit TctC
MKGGKATLNALLAKDANVAWGGGIQRSLVAAGEVVILVSAEDDPLVQAPNGKTLKDYGIDHYFGYQFLMAGPKGMNPEARDAIAKAIREVLTNPESETHKFISKQYPPGPLLIAGDALTKQLNANYETNKMLLKK